jgi:hypothetical protein
VVDKLNGIKGALPESMRAQIDKLNAHLAANGASAPTHGESPMPAAPPQSQ